MYPALDHMKFSQKWRLIPQANGTHVIASPCQPTVLLSIIDGKTTYRYGIDGQVGELGAWNPSYDCRMTPHAWQKWWISEPSPGEFRIVNAATGGYFTLMHLLPAS